MFFNIAKLNNDNELAYKYTDSAAMIAEKINDKKRMADIYNYQATHYLLHTDRKSVV